MSCLICDRIDMIKCGENPYFVCELETGYIVLGDHQRFYGYTLFLCKEHKTELFHLEHDFKLKFMEEMSLVAEAAAKAFAAEKMNYELLGMGDAHVHWHLFPRREGDTPQTGPVWWLPREEMWNDEYRPSGVQLEEMKAKLLDELAKIK